MTTVDDIHNNYSRKLEQARVDHYHIVEEEMQQLQDILSKKTRPIQPADVRTSVASIEEKGARLSMIQSSRKQQALVNMTDSDPLRSLDKAFLSTFDLHAYYPVNRLAYPTIYCETLEEFFTPFLADMNYSEKTRQQELIRLISEAKEVAEKQGGGIFGVNFPGQGCYLNGWLFATLAHIQPNEVAKYPDIFRRVISTAAHEKLGHGFLSAYSTLGELKTSLGLSLVQVASQFGILSADDPMAQLRYQQNILLFTVSQFLEEGWATWIENYIEMYYLRSTQQPRHSVQSIITAIQKLPHEIKNVEQVKKSLMQSLGVLFTVDDVPMDELLPAVNYLAFVGSQLDDYFGNMLHQPLRYAVGELLCMQATANMGEECIPYAVLIAANVTFDPTKISLTDLDVLLKRDPRLNPDTRLAAISRIKLNQKGNLQELTQRINSELSLSIPPELRK